jgi:hypothetical protein
MSRRLFGIFVLILIFAVSWGSSPIPKPKTQQVQPVKDAVDSKFVKRACPNNCNGHGTCNASTNICTCSAGWSGVDCSIQLIPLTNNTIVSSNVALHAWRIYTITAMTGSQLIVEVNQTTSGDADIYLRFNDIPTRTEYDYRDQSSRAKVKLTIDVGTRSGTWFIGVFGYAAVSFTIRAIVSGNLCPNNCNDRGICVNGVCNCTSGYYGTDCSDNYRDLSPNNPIFDQVASSQWKYFRSHLTTGNFLEFELYQVSLGDCDLYVQYNQPPTLTNYLFSNVTVLVTSTISINDAALGYWFVGVYGFRSCSFRIQQDPPRAQCPNECSHRGSCSGTTCTCRAGSAGEYCQILTDPVMAGIVYQGYVQQNLWNFYHYISNSLDNLVITVNQEESQESDCDLYVKAGALPNRSSYDYFDLSMHQIFSLTIPRPGQDTWYIGIFGWKTCTYTFRVDLSSSCPNNCNNHGSCNSEGICVCEPGFSGVDCSQTADYLQNNVVVSGSVSNNQWAYYFFTLLQSESVYFHVRELDGSVGEVGLYVSKDVPDLHNYEYASASTQESVHRVSIHFASEETVTYQVGVYGGPFIQQNRRVNFQLVAYSPDF